MSSQPSLYEARVPVFPRRVKGKFRTWKWWIMAITLGIYYLAPWLRWDRGAELPDQAILVDLANRRFFFFWIEIWPHEFYFVAGLLIMAGLGLFLFTSAMGRVWCGYTCPQTVWTDLFILVERWIEGDRNARVRLHKAPWSTHKLRLRLMKWTTWFLIALATGGAWVFYFTDAPQLLRDLINFSAPGSVYATMLILTLTTFVFGGFMREQVCIYMCPWPRIQAAMMDPNTITVGYRDWRGEPRGKHRKSEGAEALGDCIDCNACVNVCPMGIDIRDGQQLECITCALCIDACDDVMTKLGKPRGLIDYLSLADEPRERAGEPIRPVWHHILRTRTLIYTALWSAIGVGLLVALFIRTDFKLTVTPIRNPSFVTLSDGTVRNIYDLQLGNQSGEARAFEISIHGDVSVDMDLEGIQGAIITVPADSTLSQRLYLSAAPGTEAAKAHISDLRIWAEDVEGEARVSRDTTFNGKG